MRHQPLRGRAPLGAIILIALGALFLLANFGIIPNVASLFAKWWPLILIAVGATMLLRR